MVGVILICLAAMGYAGLGMRYMRVKGPMIHHAAILSHDGIEVEDAHSGAFTAVYRSTGAVLLSMAVALIGLAVFPVYRGETWASLVILMICGLMTYGACLKQFKIEQRTGVRMVWRPAAVVNVMLLLGLLLS